MHNTLKFIISLAVAIVLMLIVRAYAFTICTVATDSLKPELKRGDKMIVNRLVRKNIKKNDLVVYGDSVFGISRVAAVGGDTIRVGEENFTIDDNCSNDCDCGACHTYLLTAGNDSVLISGKEIIGKAYPLTFRRTKRSLK